MFVAKLGNGGLSCSVLYVCCVVLYVRLHCIYFMFLSFLSHFILRRLDRAATAVEGLSEGSGGGEAI